MLEQEQIQEYLNEADALLHAGKHLEALAFIEEILLQQDLDSLDLISLLVTKADCLHAGGSLQQAAALYEECAKKGGPMAAVLWRKLAEVEAQSQEIDKALLHVRYCLSLNFQDIQAQYLAAILHFTSTLFIPGCVHAHQLLKYAKSDEALVPAENLFRFAQSPAEAYEVVKRRADIAEDPSTFLGLLVCGAQGLCHWDDAEHYAHLLEENFFKKGDFHTAKEIPLYNIARTSHGPTNLAVAQVQTEHLQQIQPAFCHEQHPWGKPIKLGFLSADFSAHPVIMLLLGFLEALNKDEVLIYAYDDGIQQPGEFATRLAQVVHKHVDVREQSDMDVAKRVYADGIDVLVDLMGLTTKNRIGVLALRPSPASATFLGFPGSTGVSSVDYIIADSVVVPPEYTQHFAEKICRLPESFMPCDSKRRLAANPVTRTDVGLPENAVVFASFNRSFKLDRPSVELWMRILSRAPNSVLWQKADEPNMQRMFQECALDHGIDPRRIIFAGNTASVALHLTRTGLADFGLDTLVYNGHTITTDLLWAGVPVITCTGTHFASRVSTSLLHSVGLGELAQPTPQAMEDLAVALALNPARRHELRKRLEGNLRRMPLFDSARYAAHFTQALNMMVDRAKQGLSPDHLNVPPLPTRTEDFLPDGPPTVMETYQNTPKDKPYSDIGASLNIQRSESFIHYLRCPICQTQHSSQGLPLPWPQHITQVICPTLPNKQLWVPCPECKHLFTMGFWTKPSLDFLAQSQCQGEVQALSTQALEAAHSCLWHLAQKTRQILGESFVDQAQWLDVGGKGLLPFVAQSAGFNPSVVQCPTSITASLQAMGINATTKDFLTLHIMGQAKVLSLCGSLEQAPYPGLILAQARQCLHPEGLLVLGLVESASSVWELYDGFSNANPIFHQVRRQHVFSPISLEISLHNNGFEVVDVMPDFQYPMEKFLFAKLKKESI